MRGNFMLKSSILALSGAAALCAFASSAVPPPKALDIDAGRALFDRTLRNPADVPVSFEYASVRHRGLGDFEILENSTVQTSEGFKGTMRAKVDDTLSVRVETAYCARFGESEYTVWFENAGTAPSKVLRDVVTADVSFDGDRPVLRGIMGDHDNFYAGYEQDLSVADKYFRSDNGRATHIVFPYFDLVHGEGGTLLALGWAGTWRALFSAGGGSARVRARTCAFLDAALMPGEKLRTGLVVMLPYRGRDGDDAANLWRRWFLECNAPKANEKGDLLKPFSTFGFAGDTGLPNSDGSISERHFTWKPTLDKLVAENIVPDFRWFDAGWYFDPSGNTVESDWWGTVGSWELDTVKWPGKSFRESNEACHKAGMKVFAWFEPERVTHVDELVRNYGYKKEWGVDSGWCVTSNLGDPECLRWTLGRIVKMMDENAVDMYREDNNSDPAGSWGRLDDAETRKLGLPRWGVNENKCIQGHYALWDGIIDYCRKAGKCPYVDSCASGGGRNDIESMRRGFPMMRSDFDRTTTSMRLSQTWGFCKWIPFHGSSTKETAGQLEGMPGPGADRYIVRASLLPIWNYGDSVTQNKDLDFDLLRANIGIWKSVRHLLVRDFYTLTPWRHELDRSGWTVFAYDAPELGESIVLAFRQEECAEGEFTARLKFADPSASYEIADDDSSAKRTVSGAELRKGLALSLPSPRSSLLLRLKRL